METSGARTELREISHLMVVVGASLVLHPIHSSRSTVPDPQSPLSLHLNAPAAVKVLLPKDMGPSHYGLNSVEHKLTESFLP